MTWPMLQADGMLDQFYEVDADCLNAVWWRKGGQEIFKRQTIVAYHLNKTFYTHVFISEGFKGDWKKHLEKYQFVLGMYAKELTHG